jgi:hypothetical protein
LARSSANWRVCSIVSKLLEKCLQGISHLISIAVWAILLVVALGCYDLTLIIRFGTAVFDEDNRLGHLGLVVANVLESAVTAAWEHAI